MANTIGIEEVCLVLTSSWEISQIRAPTLTRAILRYYAILWNKNSRMNPEKIEEYIEMVWDGRLSSPCFPFSPSWSETWDTMKVLYIAKMISCLEDVKMELLEDP